MVVLWSQPVLGHLNPVGKYPRYWSVFSWIQSYVCMYVCNKHFVNRARDSTELQTWSRRMKKSKQQGRKGVLRCDAPPTSAIVQSTRTETKEPNTMVFYTKKHTLCTACTCTYTTCVLTLYYLLLYYTPPPASHPDIAGGECKLFF